MAPPLRFLVADPNPDIRRQVKDALTTRRQADVVERDVADVLAAAVDIRVHRKTKRGEQGEIAIAFGSLEELNGLLEKLGIAED